MLRLTMKIRHSGGGQDSANEQAWELINDLALYETWKPFLDPIANDKEPSRAGDAADTYRAVIIKLETGRAPRCLDRIGTLNPCEDDEDRLLGRIEHEQSSTLRAVARALAPVTRAFHRVRHGGDSSSHRPHPQPPERFPERRGRHER
jgi:hypothetical protein